MFAECTSVAAGNTPVTGGSCPDPACCTAACDCTSVKARNTPAGLGICGSKVDDHRAGCPPVVFVVSVASVALVAAENRLLFVAAGKCPVPPTFGNIPVRESSPDGRAGSALATGKTPDGFPWL